MAAPSDNARFWDKIARKYARDPISDMAGYARTLERVRDYLRPDHSVFEFGCGTGTSALNLAPNAGKILATDISGEMIAIAREKVAAAGIANVTFEKMTPDDPSLPTAAFDIVLGFNVVHLMPDWRNALRDVHRLLKPGGLFISKTPCVGEMNPFIRFAIPVAQLFGKAPYVDAFRAEALEREIVDAGFSIIERGRHGSKGKDVRAFVVAQKA